MPRFLHNSGSSNLMHMGLELLQQMPIGGKRPHPAAVIKQIKAAATTEAILGLHHAHEKHIDRIHVSACWSSLGQLVTQRPAERTWLQSNAQASDMLVQHTVRAAELGEINARSVANMAYGAARSGMVEALRVTIVALASSAERWVNSSKPQWLANAAWASAKGQQ